MNRPKIILITAVISTNWDKFIKISATNLFIYSFNHFYPILYAWVMSSQSIMQPYSRAVKHLHKIIKHCLFVFLCSLFSYFFLAFLIKREGQLMRTRNNHFCCFIRIRKFNLYFIYPLVPSCCGSPLLLRISVCTPFCLRSRQRNELVPLMQLPLHMYFKRVHGSHSKHMSHGILHKLKFLYSGPLSTRSGPGENILDPPGGQCHHQHHDSLYPQAGGQKLS